MSATRILRHMIAPGWIVSRAFPRATLKRIERAIAASESRHGGELRFAVEAGLDLVALLRGMSPRQRAHAVFSELGVWDTAENSGVLIYVQVVDRRIEIVADRGISALVGETEWNGICSRMEAAFRAREFERGALAGIAEVTALLSRHFPPRGGNPNELPDRPVVL